MARRSPRVVVFSMVALAAAAAGSACTNGTTPVCDDAGSCLVSSSGSSSGSAPDASSDDDAQADAPADSPPDTPGDAPVDAPQGG